MIKFLFQKTCCNLSIYNEVEGDKMGQGNLRSECKRNGENSHWCDLQVLNRKGRVAGTAWKGDIEIRRDDNIF